MIPTCIRLKGFMSYQEPQELRFDQDGLWVLEGPNGVGKSTIFDAITFALFGEHRLGRRNDQDLINHHSDGLEVELTMRLAGTTYKLQRTVPKNEKKAKKRSTWLISEQKPDGLWAPIARTEQKEDYLAWVQEQIGLDYEGFTTTVLLLQGESEKLIKQDPVDRRKLLGQLIDLSRYERLHERAKVWRDTHRREADSLARKVKDMGEVSPEDVEGANAALLAVTQERDALGQRIEGLNQSLPQAQTQERLLGEQRALQRQAEAEQEILSQAADIRERAAELLRLEPLLAPLREVASTRAQVAACEVGAAQGEARACALQQEEAAATAREQEARKQEEVLRQRQEELAEREEALRTEREGLGQRREKWNAAEVLRRSMGERAAGLRAQQPALEEAEARRALGAARAALLSRQEEAAQLQADRKAVAQRLTRIAGLDGQLGGQAESVTCSECGQAVTAAHVSGERLRLLGEQERLGALGKAAVQAQKDAAAAVTQAERAQETASQQLLLHRQLEQAQRDLTQVLQGLTPEEAQAALARLSELESQLALVKKERAVQQQALQDAKKALKLVGEQVQELARQVRQLGQELAAGRSQRQQAQGRLDVFLGQLPEELRGADAELVAQTEARVSALLPYRGLEARLLQAEAGEAGRRLAEIGRQLDALPPGLPAVAALQLELSRSRAAYEGAQKARDEQAVALQTLLLKREERAKLDAQQETAQQEYRLYDLLADLLGPEALQRHLVRDAEQAIVHNANQELGGLTQGRIRLALREGKEGEDAAQKALDLMVSNDEAGEKPMALALASGSQKFRIAISLALGIGRYLARETRRVESVIIDEGFGCLDRANREDAVAVLQELSGHMARVILVSHQEEFAGRFSSGYRIELVDRTSVPTRVSR